jgi:nitrogen fixation protein FixH
MRSSVLKGPFTGWHMLGVMCLFFGVVIGVNITMAVFAGSSWSGLVVKNTYVASQTFDDDVREVERMKAMGWQSHLQVSAHTVAYSLTNALGVAVRADKVSAAFSRPVGEDQDRVVALQRAPDGHFEAAHDLSAGQWLVTVTAVKDGERIYSDVRRIVVAGGGK